MEDFCIRERKTLQRSVTNLFIETKISSFREKEYLDEIQIQTFTLRNKSLMNEEKNYVAKYSFWNQESDI